MARPPALDNLPFPVRRALNKLGQDIQDARKRRRISVQMIAERASISRSTLHKIEKGMPGVSIGAYATVLFVLGLVEKITGLLDVTQDPIGLALDEERLPKRIRRSNQSKKRNLPHG